MKKIPGKAADDPFEQDDYKISLKYRFADLRARRSSLTWRKIAAEIPIQYTYLSKALNDETTHLSDDHLFTVCRALQFFPDETDFILLQRAYALARDPERKSQLYRKIRECRQAKKINAEEQVASSSRLNGEIQYLLEPLCQIIHVALHISAYRKDPRRLCAPLSLSMEQLKEYLRVLSRNDYIELDEDGLAVKAIKANKIHFGPDHFLVRFQQTIMRSQMLTRLARTSEADKYSFLVTFNLDEASFTLLRSEFQGFLKKAERIARETRDEHVYQMSFDLFKWL